MNWDAIGAIGELLGSLAVFSTLIYLAIQTKQNSRLLRATIREQRTESNQRLQLFAAEHFGGTGEVSSRGYFYAAMFSNWDVYVRQRRDGLIDDEDWDAQILLWKLQLQNEEMKGLWPVLADKYSKELQSTINLIIGSDAEEDNA